MIQEIQDYHAQLDDNDRAIADALYHHICTALPLAVHKIWHRHPVWFLDGNPIAGYSKLKGGMRLLFWSGQSFDEPALQPEGTFRAAEVRYTQPDQIVAEDLARWLAKGESIQWDYKNLIKRKGVLERLK
jgi:hypothetical protein